MKNLKNKSGISLIVLVITIIVMIILATAIILSLNSSNITSKANWAKISSDRANLQAEYATIHSNLVASGKENITVDDVTSLPEYVAWDAKVKAAGFKVDVPEDKSNAAGIKVVLELSETSLEVYGLEYDKEKNKVKGYNWVTVKDDQGEESQAKLIIPKGFTASIYEDEDTVEEGLVIYGTNSLEGIDQETAIARFNQYVWIPVEGEFERVNWENPSSPIENNYMEPLTYGTLSASNDYTGEHAEYAKMKASVEKYGGFYIARYTAGADEIRSDVYVDGTSTVIPSRKGGSIIGQDMIYDIGTGEYVPVNKYSYAYNLVGWGTTEEDIIAGMLGDYMGINTGKGVVALARSIYPESANKDVVSTLIYGAQWDAVLKFISKTDSEFALKTMDKSCLKNNIQFSPSAEWTMESDIDGWRIVRSSTTPASRIARLDDEIWDDSCFRIALYLK